jgi:LacI family transcriptional regulator
MERCSLTGVAKAAGVSAATVSYALRGHPKIPERTVRRIRRIAERLGYTAHPSVATLMAHIRMSRMPRNPEKLAFVWIEDREAASNLAFNRQIIAGARSRARILGYDLEEFALTAPGMTAPRLSQILKSRGIAGVVFSGCDRRTGVEIEMDWTAHATAIIGHAVWNPELHRAAHHHFMGVRRIMLELGARDYRRPAALLDSIVNERACRTWEAAFCAYHPQPARARTAILKLTEFREDLVRRWLERLRPDALVVAKPVTQALVRPVLESLGLDPGIAVIDISSDKSSLSGVDPDYPMVAGNAVDLVLGQIYHNERGVPSHPKHLLFEGHWIEGGSLRRLGADGDVECRGAGPPGRRGGREAQPSRDRIHAGIRLL